MSFSSNSGDFTKKFPLTFIPALLANNTFPLPYEYPSTFQNSKEKKPSITLQSFNEQVKNCALGTLNLDLCRQAAFHPSAASKINQMIKVISDKIKCFGNLIKINRIFHHLFYCYKITTLILKPFSSRLIRIELLNRSNELLEERNQFKIALENHLEKVQRQMKQVQNQAALSSSSPLYQHITAQKVKMKMDTLNQKAAHIIAKEESISSDYKKYLLGIVKSILSNLAFVVSYSPFKILIDVAFVLGQVPGLIEVIDFAAVFTQFKQVNKNKKILDVWQKNFYEKKQQQLNDANPQEKVEFLWKKTKLHVDQPNLSWDSLAKNFIGQYNKIASHIDKNLHSTNYEARTEAQKLNKIIRLLQKENLEAVISHYLSTISEKRKIELSQLSKFSLLNEFVDYQINLEKSFQSISYHLIDRKIQLEEIFLKHTSMQTKISFWYSFAALSIALAGAAASFVMGPLAAVTGLVIAVYIASIAINTSFLISGHMLESKYHHHSLGLFSYDYWRLMITQMKYDMNSYSLRIAQDQYEKEQFVTEIKSDKYRKINLLEKKILKLKEKNQDLFAHLKQLKKKKQQQEIMDFNHFAGLNLGYNKSANSDHFYSKNVGLDKSYVENFTTLLCELKLSLMDEKTTQLLTDCFGISLDDLDYALKNFKSSIIEQTLFNDFQAYFNLKENEYTNFVKHCQTEKEAKKH